MKAPMKTPTKTTNKIHVLIAAAGTGARFDNSATTPKQYRPLNGITVLRRTIQIFLQSDAIDTIQVMIHPDHKEQYHDAITGLAIEPHIIGGKQRKDSIYNALKSLDKAQDEDIILIHDAARPLLSQTDLNALIEALKTNKAATLARPIAETLRKSDKEHCTDIIPRNKVYAMQTPQGFRYKDILNAHEQAQENIEHTDDTSLITAIGIDVKIVQGSAENFKITTKDDFTMAEKILQPNKTTRTGMGFDVHTFDTSASGPIRIGGIDIPHSHPLKGHSDADVALHTITDAILGAIGEGDIGQHFPPSDNTFKNMDSAIFLEKSVEILKAHNATINNIDLTIICEEPKIGPHAPQMRQRIASITNLPIDTINIKATTTERLGFTGRGEGIAAQAIVTITKHG